MPPKPNADRQSWEARSATYFDEVKVVFDPNEPYHLAQQDFLAELAALQWDSILEVGCGYGWHLQPIAQRHTAQSGRIVGGDFSHGQLRRGRQFLSGLPVGLAQFDARRLPFAAKSFDVLFTSGTLCYIHPDELNATLGEFRRVARRYIIGLEYAEEHATPAVLARMREVEWYSHHYARSFRQAGIRTLKSYPFRAFEDHPVRTIPWSFILGEIIL